jgi:DNA anti-recombination protein RmuC
MHLNESFEKNKKSWKELSDYYISLLEITRKANNTLLEILKEELQSEFKKCGLIS